MQPLVPPVLWGAGRAALAHLSRRRRVEAGGCERDADYYDDVYEKSVEYRKHYTASRYYFLWAVVVDRILAAGHDSVLEIGCGSGQFARLLHDKKIGRYHGVDLSEQAIGMARVACPDGLFSVADIFASSLPETGDYDVVVSTEFLEHVRGDLAVLARIRQGARVLATVPNFPYESHVRHFESAEAVFQRYAPLFQPLRVDAWAGNQAGMEYFLIDGIRRDHGSHPQQTARGLA